MRQPDYDKWDILIEHVHKSLGLMDKYLYTDKFEVICSIIDYLNRDQYGYVPFNVGEFD